MRRAGELLRLFVGLGAALILAPRPARAAGIEERGAGDPDRCPSAGRAIGDGALPTGVAGADFGAIPEACVGTDAFLRVRGSLLIAADAPDFYGNVGVAGTMRLRRALSPRWEVSLAADLLTFRYVKNAVVSSTGLDVGPPTLGVARLLTGSPRLALKLFARVLLPLDSARRDYEFGGELGLAGSLAAVRPGLGLQGGVTVGAPIVIDGGQTHGALRTSAVAEGWASGPRLGGTLGGFCRFQPTPALAGSSSVGLRAGGRVRFRRRFWAAAVTEWPLLGGDRTDLLVALYAGFTPD